MGRGSRCLLGGLAALLVAAFSLFDSAWAQRLPIYIEDSHAGSFSFFARELDLNREHTLVLVDAHSDASGVPESDRIRQGLRSVVSKQQRLERISTWREQGVIQPFNWIEPLMPRPVAQVIWIAGNELSDERLKDLEAEADTHLDWQTQAAERKCGSLRDRFKVVDWQRFSKMKLSGSVIVSVDLDYYAQANVAEADLVEHWYFLLKLPELKALSIAISRPWLKDDAQAERLLFRVLELSLLVRNADVYFEPLIEDRVDRSEMAKSYYVKGEQVPRFNIREVSAEIKDLVLRNNDLIRVHSNADRWADLIKLWQSEQSGWRVKVRDHQVSLDGVWRMKVNDAADLWIDGGGDYRNVRWWQHQPAGEVYNLLPELALGKGFTGEVGSFIEMRKSLVQETDDLALSSDTWKKLLPWAETAGVLRLQAEVMTDEGSRWTPVIEIRVRSCDGLRGALSEQMGSPYVFGIGRLQHQGETGGETLIGNDCANFVVYAMRRFGCRVPWCNPAQIKKYLQPWKPQRDAENQREINDTLLEQGIVIHLGSHVAVLWQDLGKPGLLDGQDLVIHHLSGVPEIIPFSTLMKGRNQYELYLISGFKPSARLVMGGDVNLTGAKPSMSIFSEEHTREMQDADATIVNLECAVAAANAERPEKPFVFQAAPECLDHLKRAGVDLVSLANNHTMDAGREGLMRLVKALETQQISGVGAGASIEDASQAYVVEVGPYRMAVIAVNLIETEVVKAGQADPGVLCYPQHREQIVEVMTSIRSEVDFVLVLPHWGKEYTDQVTPQQRELARWFIDGGADAVVGTHTHYPQRLEHYRGRPVVFSLGNLYFPNVGPPGFNRYRLLHLGLAEDHRLRVLEWSPE